MSATAAAAPASIRNYSLFLLFIAGLGGLLYGIDVGIIAGALPYMEATSGMNPGQLSQIVAAVLLGSVISVLFAGMLADLIGRKKLMIVSGILFVASIPMIAWAQGFGPLVLGRLLQGVSAGLIGVVIPLYLAECLDAANRGKGTGIFQWLLTLGIVIAAMIGYFFSIRVEEVEKLKDADKLFAFKDTAWRNIFWMTLPPGLLFVLGGFFVAESPRWYFRRGRVDAARSALLRSRTPEQAELELREMEATAAEERGKVSSTAQKAKESLLHRKYIIPFLLACVILACNQLTGVNSIIGYNTNILIQAGLADKPAHLGYVYFTVVNFLMTIVGVALVDRKGRKFLLALGSAGIIVSLLGVGVLFQRTEKQRVDCREGMQAMVKEVCDVSLSFEKDEAEKASKRSNDFTFPVANGSATKPVIARDRVTIAFDRPVADAKLTREELGSKLSFAFGSSTSAEPESVSVEVNDNVIKEVAAEGNNLILTMIPKVASAELGEPYPLASFKFDQATSDRLVASSAATTKPNPGTTSTLTVIYRVGDFVAATNAVRSDDATAKSVVIKPDKCLPTSPVEAFFKNPFASLAKSKGASLVIENAIVTPVPSTANGWTIAVFSYLFIAFFAVGPGVCVWLALSELMPTRIRSNGMSIALLINQAVSTTIALIFLPTVGKYGYATMFFAFAGFTVIYFITAAFFLPETKGKTLEEIEEHFAGKGRK